MATNITNLNGTELSTSTTSETPVIRPAGTQQGESATASPKNSKRRESFFSALLRAFSSVAC